jgi:hypothetical protein
MIAIRSNPEARSIASKQPVECFSPLQETFVVALLVRATFLRPAEFDLYDADGRFLRKDSAVLRARSELDRRHFQQAMDVARDEIVPSQLLIATHE